MKQILCEPAAAAQSEGLLRRFHCVNLDDLLFEARDDSLDVLAEPAILTHSRHRKEAARAGVPRNTHPDLLHGEASPRPAVVPRALRRSRNVPRREETKTRTLTRHALQ